MPSLVNVHGIVRSNFLCKGAVKILDIVSSQESCLRAEPLERLPVCGVRGKVECSHGLSVEGSFEREKYRRTLEDLMVVPEDVSPEFLNAPDLHAALSKNGFIQRVSWQIAGVLLEPVFQARESVFHVPEDLVDFQVDLQGPHA